MKFIYFIFYKIELILVNINQKMYALLLVICCVGFASSVYYGCAISCQYDVIEHQIIWQSSRECGEYQPTKQIICETCCSDIEDKTFCLPNCEFAKTNFHQEKVVLTSLEDAERFVHNAELYPSYQRSVVYNAICSKLISIVVNSTRFDLVKSLHRSKDDPIFCKEINSEYCAKSADYMIRAITDLVIQSITENISYAELFGIVWEKLYQW